MEKKNKDALGFLEGNYKSLFNSASDMIKILDLNGNVLDVNLAFEENYGWSREEVVGKPLPTVPKDLLNQQNDLMEQARTGQKVKRIVTTRSKKDGTLIEVSLAISPIFDEEGNVVALSGISRDISKQRQLKQSLKESEERYRKVVELSPKGILIHKDGMILYANPAAKRIINDENLVGKPVFTYIHTKYHEICKQRAAEVKASGELSFIEIEINRKDGKSIYIEVGGVVIDFDGAPSVLSLFSDITDRKQAENALCKSEEMYRLLADNSLDLIQLVNMDGIVTYASPSHKTVIGYPPEAYVGKRVFYQPDHGVDDPFEEVLGKMVTTLKPFTYEIHRKHKNGYDIWLDLEITPVFNGDGEFKHMMIVGRDITERKQRQEILEFKANHDHLTALPNRGLLGETLKQSLKEADRYGRKLAVMFIDMDNFKHVNDTLGHDSGDELLKQFAKRVKACIRGSDMIARLGGDEFVILFPVVKDEEQIIMIAERILSAVDKPWHIFNHVLESTSSIGIAFNQKGDKSHTLLKRADMALYKAKSKGKNTYCLFQSEVFQS